MKDIKERETQSSQTKWVHHAWSVLVVDASVGSFSQQVSDMGLGVLGYFILSPQHIPEIAGCILLLHGFNLCLVSIVWSMDIKVHSGNLWILARHLALTLHHEVVTHHGQELHRVDFLAIECYLDMQVLIAYGYIISCAHILAKGAEGFLDMGIDDLVGTLVAVSIVLVGDSDVEAFLHVTGNT